MTVILCTIWYFLYNLKNTKNTHGVVLLLLKLQVSACNFTKSNTPPWVFFTFLNSVNGIKSSKASHTSIPLWRCIKIYIPRNQLI